MLLKRYRLESGLPQEALAARTSLSARGISDLECGIKYTPRFDTLNLLTNALSLSSQQRTLLFTTARPEAAVSGDPYPALPSHALPLPRTTLICPPYQGLFSLLPR